MYSKKNIQTLEIGWNAVVVVLLFVIIYQLNKLESSLEEYFLASQPDLPPCEQTIQQ